MKYAIFSDIHGNLPALEAALADAKEHGAGMFLFLGDYYMHYPFWVNEVVETIRGLSDAVVIGGNNEGYLTSMRAEDQSAWTYAQFMPVYSSYRALKQENLDYLTSLPARNTVYDAGGDIYLSHLMDVFYRTPKIEAFHSSGFRKKMENEKFSHGEYLAYAREALLGRPEALAEMRELPEGVYLFGHNHIQFHIEMEGRLFVNPGSCGAACDCNPGASYTIIEYIGGAEDDSGAGGGVQSGWRVLERKAAYDVDYTADILRKSTFAAEAPMWAEVIGRMLLTGADYFGPFVRHITQTGRRLGYQAAPMPDEVFARAVDTWDPDELYM